jgi:glycerol uptake facilitator-like aquaporin
MQSENKDVVSEIETIQCFSLAACYITALGIVNAGKLSNSCALNPAISIGIFLFSLFSLPGEALKWFWIFAFGPF